MATLNPYLNFRGNAKEAMEFYHSVFGGELISSTFADYGMEVQPEESGQIMHSQLTTPSGFTLMGADTPAHMTFAPGVHDFSVSLSGSAEEDDELSGYYEKLSEGGEKTEPLTAAPWGDKFGMLMDRFGISWLVNIAGAEQQ